VQLQQANAELSAANTALKVANTELDSFAHTVAHDSQNPLGLIIGYSDYLLESFSETDPEQALNILRTIRKTGQKMSNITAELLLLASVRKGTLKLKALNMAEIVAQAQQRLAFMIEEYGGEIALPDTWPVAQGYAPWIEEVWANYLSNGLKYGGRPPRLKLGASSEGEGMIRFWIHDNGPGLDAAAQAQLFTQFTRLDETRATGHGLGLSIVKRIVEKLGGQVEVESKGTPGEGTIFSFTLPRAGGQ
jgi:signal transduction histidine kinase